MARHFDVYDVFWVVNDFNLATCPENSYMQSPEFTISGSHHTKWVLKIEFKKEDEEDKDIVIHLQRCDYNLGPAEIYVNWRLSINYPEYDAVLLERFCIMEEFSRYREPLRDRTDLIKLFNSDEIEVLTFKCTMITYTDISEKEFQRSSHKGKMSLSESLIDLLNDTIMCDLALEVGDRRIMVHKAIMCARLEIFRHLIEKSRKDKENVVSNETSVIDLSLKKCREIDSVDLSDLKYNAVESLVKYIYSGDLVHVLLRPSLDIYDCVKKLLICNEMIPLEAKILTIHSTMDIYGIGLPWTITNFSKNLVYGIESPYTVDRHKIGWKLLLVTHSKYDYLSIFILTKGRTNAANILVEIALLNEIGNETVLKRILRCSTDDFGSSKNIGFPKFIRKDKMEQFLKDDKLRLDLKIKLSEGILQSTIVRYNVPVIKHTNKQNSFDLLSLHMNKLLQTKEFSDVELCFEDVQFVLHRCILATSSRYFLCLLENEHGKYKINVPNIGNFSTDTYYKFFTYLYSGVVETEDKDHLQSLKKAASIYDLPVLKELLEDVVLKDP